MILIVIFVHAIAADEMQRWKSALQLKPDHPHIFKIGFVIDRIGFLLAHDAGVRDVLAAHQADGGDLLLRERDQIAIRHGPEIIVLAAEIFKPEAGRGLVRDHLRRPGPEVLHPADLDLRIVDINPIVGPCALRVADKDDGEKIAVFERPRMEKSERRRTELCNEFLDRRRGDDMAGLETFAGSIAADGIHRPNLPMRIEMQFLEFAVHDNAAAGLLNFSRGGFPHHAGAPARIAEGFDQGFGAGAALRRQFQGAP